MLTLSPKTGLELLVYKVPEDAHGFRVKGNEISFWYNVTKGGSSEITIFPPGNYSFISTTNRITEEQAAELVEKDPVYEGYKEYYKDGPLVNDSAIHSLFSLLRSQGLDPGNKNYAILKKS